ncbi:MAG: NADH-quinone oxidoreductase subunit H [Chloroflexi bacterium RBG_16_57_8]|nr:MAG: NADH-quinone oxidoreductase subunit H [Chloroflexi bacterium RBG_16_57_8]
MSAVSSQQAALAPDWPGNFWWHLIVFSAILIGFVLVMVLAFVWIERRGMGRMQARLGPNRCGPFGLMQSMADALKVLLKEDIVPLTADKIVHLLAPIVAFAPMALIFAVVPFGDGALLADLNVGILYVVAIASVSSVGILMAGWGSSNKYSLLGAMRSVAAMVSYEIPLVFSLIGIVMIAGSLSLNQIVIGQDIPFVLLQPLGFLVFFIAGCAEINRSPFDLMEADSELTAGFHTEYSGMKFALFYLVEYGEALALAAMISTLFLGGWRGPILPPWLWLVGKIVVVFFVMVWTRTTLPRARIDQLMALAWKFLFPLAVINFLVTAVEVLTWPDGLPWPVIFVNFGIMVVLVLLFSRSYKVGLGKVEA